MTIVALSELSLYKMFSGFRSYFHIIDKMKDQTNSMNNVMLVDECKPAKNREYDIRGVTFGETSQLWQAIVEFTARRSERKWVAQERERSHISNTIKNLRRVSKWSNIAIIFSCRISLSILISLWTTSFWRNRSWSSPFFRMILIAHLACVWIFSASFTSPKFPRPFGLYSKEKGESYLLFF